MFRLSGKGDVGAIQVGDRQKEQWIEEYARLPPVVVSLLTRKGNQQQRPTRISIVYYN